MKTAICYYSVHHKNTLKVLEAIAGGRDIDLIDVTAGKPVDLDQYDAVGFASGIYYGKFHESVRNYAKQNLPEGKPVFLIYTYGSPRDNYTEAARDTVKEKNANIIGIYSCRGFDTYGPFKLIGGTAKGHPDADDLRRAAEFYEGLKN